MVYETEVQAVEQFLAPHAGASALAALPEIFLKEPQHFSFRIRYPFRGEGDTCGRSFMRSIILN